MLSKRENASQKLNKAIRCKMACHNFKGGMVKRPL